MLSRHLELCWRRAFRRGKRRRWRRPRQGGGNAASRQPHERALLALPPRCAAPEAQQEAPAKLLCHALGLHTLPLLLLSLLVKLLRVSTPTCVVPCARPRQHVTVCFLLKCFRVKMGRKGPSGKWQVLHGCVWERVV